MAGDLADDDGTVEDGPVEDGPVEDGPVGRGTEPVRFGLDGIDYVVDLPADDASQLRAALAPYTAAARRIPRHRKRRAGASTPAADETSRIRAWASDNGFAVGPRGRLPQAVLEAYHARRRSR